MTKKILLILGLVAILVLAGVALTFAFRAGQGFPEMGFRQVRPDGFIDRSMPMHRGPEATNGPGFREGAGLHFGGWLAAGLFRLGGWLLEVVVIAVLVAWLLRRDARMLPAMTPPPSQPAGALPENPA